MRVHAGSLACGVGALAQAGDDPWVLEWSELRREYEEHQEHARDYTFCRDYTPVQTRPRA